MLLSIVVPCFNEERTLAKCIEHVLRIADEHLALEVIIVDDCSRDASVRVADQLAAENASVHVVRHDVNQGKGAALRTGFERAAGDVVAVQDADLEYDPQDLKRLLQPFREGKADVVLGSRFLSRESHRVLYFWHYVGNRLLTLLSNIFTDLNLTDMECCYKLFSRDVIKGIRIEENRFGVEPELVAKIAHRRLRIYEMGISYSGRTYEEGKKIGLRDAFRALYCIIRYNADSAPVPLQFLVYLFIGGVSAIVNLVVFLLLLYVTARVVASAAVAFVVAALCNYVIGVWLLFRRGAKWRSTPELAAYAAVVAVAGCADVVSTDALIAAGLAAASAKLIASAIALILNFSGRRFFVFPGPTRPDWSPSQPESPLD